MIAGTRRRGCSKKKRKVSAQYNRKRKYKEAHLDGGWRGQHWPLLRLSLRIALGSGLRRGGDRVLLLLLFLWQKGLLLLLLLLRLRLVLRCR